MNNEKLLMWESKCPDCGRPVYYDEPSQDGVFCTYCGTYMDYENKKREYLSTVWQEFEAVKEENKKLKKQLKK